MRTANALTRLRFCAGSPEPSLVTYIYPFVMYWLNLCREISFALLGSKICARTVCEICDSKRKIRVVNLYYSLGKFSRRQNDVFLIGYRKIGFDTSCKLSPEGKTCMSCKLETTCMKCQSLFSGEKKKRNIFLLKYGLGVISVKETSVELFTFQSNFLV